MAGRWYILREATYEQLLEKKPNVAVLPWGASEAHNYHMPHGTDFIQTEETAEAAAAKAVERDARPLILPPIPFGNNGEQLPQVATIHLSTQTAWAILLDVARSLKAQGIDRLIIFNGHGGNNFKPLVRDLQHETGLLVVLMHCFDIIPETVARTMDKPGDHADERETSLMLYLHPELVDMDRAGPGEHRDFELGRLSQPGVWTPRPWNHMYADTGCGDPSQSTAEKGKALFEAIRDTLADVLVELSHAKKGQLPYV
jgi:creatinine amidohydrolase